MNGLPRYDFHFDAFDNIEMRLRDDGEYVSHDDAIYIINNLRASLGSMTEYAERYLCVEEDRCEPERIDQSIRDNIAKAKKLLEDTK